MNVLKWIVWILALVFFIMGMDKAMNKEEGWFTYNLYGWIALAVSWILNYYDDE